MSDRFSLRPLRKASLGAIRQRRVHEDEPRDIAALAVLLGLPVVGAVVAVCFRWEITETESLTGGFSLLAAALLAVFVQLATWRGQFRQSGKFAALAKHEGPARRSIDEAVAHTLLASILSIFGAALMVVIANAAMPQALAVALTASAVALGVYLVLTFTLIANLLFDAYESVNDESKAVTDEERTDQRGASHR